MTRLFPYYQSYQRPNVITSQVSLYETTSTTTSRVVHCLCIYLIWIENVLRFLQRFDALLDGFNAREYFRHSLELGANRTLYARCQS